jgi:Rad3-related DNA helicase
MPLLLRHSKGNEVVFPYDSVQGHQAERSAEILDILYNRERLCLLLSPTGSGKTSTLLSPLVSYVSRLKKNSVNCHHPRVVYVTPSHLQLDQVVHELRRTQNARSLLAKNGLVHEYNKLDVVI